MANPLSFSNAAFKVAGVYILSKAPALAKTLRESKVGIDPAITKKVVDIVSTLPDVKKLKLTPEQAEKFASMLWFQFNALVKWQKVGAAFLDGFTRPLRRSRL